jgi:hypothetical protein
LIEPQLLACKRPKRAKPRENAYDSTNIRIIEGRQIGRIYSIEKAPYDGLVWNLTVENDNSYVANGTVVHNSVSAALYAIYAAHEDDYNPMTARFDIPMGEPVQKKGGMWVATCTYGHNFEVDQPGDVKCPHVMEDGRTCGESQGGFLKTAQAKARMVSTAELEPKQLASSLLAPFYAEEPKKEKNFSIPNFDQL